VDRTEYGNDDGMVYWIRKDDGSWDYDFSVLDRYLALVKKHLVAPTTVAVQVWHSHGWTPNKADQENTVAVIDPRKPGRRTHVQVPIFATAESKAFWKPVLTAIHDRLARQGLDKAMCLGYVADGGIPTARSPA